MPTAPTVARGAARAAWSRPASSTCTCTCASPGRSTRRPGQRRRGGRRRRLHGGRLHAEHVADQRQRRGDAVHPRQGRRGAAWRASIRLARRRSARRASRWPRSASSRPPAASPCPTTGSRSATALLMRRVLEYAGMLDVLVIDHCEDPTLKGDGVVHEGDLASALGLRGIPGEAEELWSSATSRSRADRGRVPRRAPEHARVAARRARRQGARHRGDLRGRAASLRAHRRGPARLRHQHQDEPAAAAAGRRRRAGRGDWPTAASTSSRPITRRTTPTRRRVDTTRRRSASPASRRPCR